METEIKSSNDYEDNDNNLIVPFSLEQKLLIHGEDSCCDFEETSHGNIRFKCAACLKTFTTNSSLKRHEERSPICLKWLSVEKKNIPFNDGCRDNSFNFIDFLDDMKQTIISGKRIDGQVLEQKNMCIHCLTQFSNTGNLHKHYKNAIVCNQLALYSFFDFIKSLSPSIEDR
jgi:hypothetical protein